MSAGGPIEERRVEVDGIDTLVRSRPGDGHPVVFLHGNPNDSRQWTEFMLATDRPSIAIDLPGFGRSARPGPGFDGSMHGLARFFGRALDELGVDAHDLVVHDWGSLGLITAQQRAGDVGRIVIADAVPLLPGYRWHWIARIWRTPGLGEAFNAANTRSGLELVLRQARPGLAPMPGEFVDDVWEAWDAGMARAVLELYRSADPPELALAGSALHELTGPALVIWGDRDPYLPARFALAYGARLPDATVELYADAGHWPWVDRPEIVDRVAAFLESR